MITSLIRTREVRPVSGALVTGAPPSQLLDALHTLDRLDALYPAGLVGAAAREPAPQAAALAADAQAGAAGEPAGGHVRRLGRAAARLDGHRVVLGPPGQRHDEGHGERGEQQVV